MNQKHAIFTTVAALALATLACGINLNLPNDAINIGPLVSEDLNVSTPNGTAEVNISFGTGTLKIEPGSPNSLILGQATYNVEELAPKISTSGNSVDLESGTLDYDIGGLPNFNDVENDWHLFFSSHPMNLEIRTGASKGEFELGGLSLENLRIFGGGADINLKFSTPNLVPMSSMTVTSGASDVELLGLSNANFSLFKFTGGGGNYTLDFSGTLQRDATVEINSGVSNFSVLVPAGIPAVVNIKGALNNVNAKGEWVGEGTTFSQAGSGPTLTFTIDLGVGNLTLENSAP